MARIFQRYYPGYIVTPGDVIENYLEAMNITAKGLAIRSELSETIIESILEYYS
jgi:hypothetical protein